MIVLRFWGQIPIQLFLLSHVFEIVGGGESVVLAMLYSIAADAVPDAERYVDSAQYDCISFTP